MSKYEVDSDCEEGLSAAILFRITLILSLF